MDAALNMAPVQLLLALHLGWLPLRALRQTHRGGSSIAAEILLRQMLETVLGRPVTTFGPRPYAALSQQLWAETIGFLRRFCTPAGADARRPTPLGGQPVRDVVVRYHGRQVWHPTSSATLTRDEIHRVFPHGGFDRALHWLANRGSHFRQVQRTARHRASRVHFVLTEIFALDCVLFGFEVSLRITYRTVLPTDQT